MKFRYATAPALALVVLSATSACSDDPPKPTYDAASYCTHSATFLKTVRSLPPMGQDDDDDEGGHSHPSTRTAKRSGTQFKSTFDKLSNTATSISRVSPSVDVANGWRAMSTFYTKSVDDLDTHLGDDKQAEMTASLDDAMTRCHLDFAGNKQG